MTIYKSKAVSDLQRFYGDLLFPEKGVTVFRYLENLAQRLWEGIESNNPMVCMEISNYDPVFIGSKRTDIPIGDLTREVAFRTVACEYGFADWQEVEVMGKEPLNLVFENCINLMLAGLLDDLKKEVEKDSSLLTQTSQFGHQALLLHYTASNGVELWRQVVPLNLLDLTTFLLENGADKNAKMKVYGGQFDTLTLLTSSAHPFDAGVGEELVAVLKGNRKNDFLGGLGLVG